MIVNRKVFFEWIVNDRQVKLAIEKPDRHIFLIMRSDVIAVAIEDRFFVYILNRLCQAVIGLKCVGFTLDRFGVDHENFVLVITSLIRFDETAFESL